MSRTSKLLTSSVAASAELHLTKIGRTGSVAIKLRAVSAAYKHGITAVAKIFDTTKATLISWIKHVKEDSFDLLNVQKGRGPKRILLDSHKEIIKVWMTEDPQITIDKVRQKLKEQANLDIGRSTVHRAMKSLDFSYITARPKHYKQDPVKTEEIKKKSIKPYK
jgi:transposase